MAIPLFAWIIAGLVAAVGVLLLVLPSRRSGSAPHCRKCGYELSGRDGVPDKCPECGRTLAGHPRRVVAGKPEPTLPRRLVGELLLLVGVLASGAFVLAGVANSAVYRAMPPEIVLVAARNGAEPAQKALLDHQRNGWRYDVVQHELLVDDETVWPSSGTFRTPRAPNLSEARPGSRSGSGYHLDTGDWTDHDITPGRRRVALRSTLHLEDGAGRARQLDYTPTFDIELLETRAAVPDRFVDNLDDARWLAQRLTMSADPRGVSLATPSGRSMRASYAIQLASEGERIEEFTHATTLRVRGQQDIHAAHFSHRYAYFKDLMTPGAPVDITLVPNEEGFFFEVDPQMLGYGIRFEGVMVLPSRSAHRGRVPTPDRIVIIDRAGNEVQFVEPVEERSMWNVSSVANEASPASAERE